MNKHIASFKNIKYLLTPYSSYKSLDLKLVQKCGIKYRNNSGANAKSVAQYALMTMLMLLGRYPELSRTNEAPDGSILGEEYHQKTAGIIGTGNVGKELVGSLHALGIKTTYFNRTLKDVPSTAVSLQQIFEQDIVFIAIASTNETRTLLKNIPTLIQPHNYLIDVSADDDLYNKAKVVKLLDQGKIKGYAIEVFNPSTLDLHSNNNFIATPHIAWCTVDAERRTVENYLKMAILIATGESKKVEFLV